MSKKSNITEEDIQAFLNAVKGAKPLSQNKVRLAPKPPPIKNISIKPPIEDPLDFRELEDIHPVEGEAFIDYKDVSISNKILRKLRKGQYNVEATLDLHGMKVEEAKVSVERFLRDCLQNGMRVVLIIHGKGQHSKTPILKNKLNHWLRRINMILAFCSAASTHGSRGAVYILLKQVSERS